MSHKSEQHNKKWLISRLKTSGSKRRYVADGDYADKRNTKRNKNWDDLPLQEGMKKSFQFFNGKINYDLLKRFLRGKVGCDWLAVKEEVDARIPSRLSEYRDCLKWFVADLVEVREDGLWNMREQKYLRMEPNDPEPKQMYSYVKYYVDPATNSLERIDDFPSRRKTKGMSKEELRKFREEEKRDKREEKSTKHKKIPKV